MSDRGRHWDEAYRSKGVKGVSWYQAEPEMSLELIRLLGIKPSDPVIDVGGGASMLVDRLLEEGFSDISVLDLSAAALEESRRRLGNPGQVTYIEADILAWKPPRRFALWHDRAVFHFLTDERDRSAYLTTLADSVRPGGGLVLGTFAEDGPEYCSGLPVARYSAAGLAECLGSAFTLYATRREVHVTPAGAEQPFTWIAAERGEPT